VVAVYTLRYNEHRPHRSLNQRPPLASTTPAEERGAGGVVALDRLRRRNRLGGLIHEYELAASRGLSESAKRYSIFSQALLDFGYTRA